MRLGGRSAACLAVLTIGSNEVYAEGEASAVVRTKAAADGIRSSKWLYLDLI
jgi:hypothetical protein